MIATLILALTFFTSASSCEDCAVVIVSKNSALSYLALSKIAFSISPISSSTTDSLILCCVLHSVPHGTLVYAEQGSLFRKWRKPTMLRIIQIMWTDRTKEIERQGTMTEWNLLTVFLKIIKRVLRKRYYSLATFKVRSTVALAEIFLTGFLPFSDMLCIDKFCFVWADR